MSPARVLRTALVGWLLASTLACGRGASTVTVYAAASCTSVIEEIAGVYADSTGQKILTRFGASGVLARTIEEGAPADLFISANALWMDELTERDLLEPATARIVAWNRLVFVVPSDAMLPPPAHAAAIVNLERIAIGDPEAVPAGNYARQALTQMGVWTFLERKLVQAPDVRAVLALVERGEVDGGVVYATDARASRSVRVAFEFSESTHDPIAYPAAVLKQSRDVPAARRFLDFLSSPRGRAIFLAHGFQTS